MKSSTELRTLLRSLDHKSYPAYKTLAGAWQFSNFVLVIDHVQGDPFASPSNLHLELSHTQTRIPAAYYAKDCTRIALQDYLTRTLGKEFERYNFKAKGSGKSGLISISRCGQEILERSACQIEEKTLCLRFEVGFPAFGRTINAGELEKILFEFLPRCVENSLFYRNMDKNKLEQAIFLAEDQEQVRKILKQEGWVAFVANGAVLPRKSGVSSLPMSQAVPFTSPKRLEKTLTLPHAGQIKGMAIPKGITLIVGGGYHGKSTLLEAIQSGVYNHVSGDGREFVITDDTAVKLRAEDGRSVRNVDISLFINDLPNKKDTTRFSTADASGSTSQAAGVVESMEAGTKLFLIDEDTTATNFMVRDAFMQQVIVREKEPITPFIERTRDLYEKADISTIMVAGSSGAFFYMADLILQMDCYHMRDITEQVKEMCKERSDKPAIRSDGFFVPTFQRVLPPYKKSRGGRNDRYEHMKVKSHGLESVSLDREEIDVRYLEQLVDSEQTQALAYWMRLTLEQILDGKKSVQQVVQTLEKVWTQNKWKDFCGSYVPCGLAKPRVQEIYACLNRYRGNEM